MEVTPSEGEAMALKVASERSRSPEEVQVGQESATLAEVHLPVELEKMETVLPHEDPSPYCGREKEVSTLCEEASAERRGVAKRDVPWRR